MTIFSFCKKARGPNDESSDEVHDEMGDETLSGTKILAQNDEFFVWREAVQNSQQNTIENQPP